MLVCFVPAAGMNPSCRRQCIWFIRLKMSAAVFHVGPCRKQTSCGTDRGSHVMAIGNTELARSFRIRLLLRRSVYSGICCCFKDIEHHLGLLLNLWTSSLADKTLETCPLLFVVHHDTYWPVLHCLETVLQCPLQTSSPPTIQYTANCIGPIDGRTIKIMLAGTPSCSSSCI